MLRNIYDRLERVESILDRGVKQTTADGVTTVYDLDHVEKRAAYLRRRHFGFARQKRSIYSQPFRVTEAADE